MRLGSTATRFQHARGRRPLALRLLLPAVAAVGGHPRIQKGIAMLTITLLLLLVALALVIAHALGKVPLWPAVLLMIVIELSRFLPVR
jgi:hypothetical protein